MRVITGQPQEVRNYIANLKDKENVIIFPENGLHPLEQADFVSSLPEDFNGDIISFSAFIISDFKEGEVFLVQENLKLKEFSKFNTYGASVNKINSSLLGSKKYIGNKVFKEFENKVNEAENINDYDTLHKLFLEIDYGFGESVEKTLGVHYILEKMDKLEKKNKE